MTGISTSPNTGICDLPRKNVLYGYPFKRLKTVRLPFAIRLSSVRDRWDAVRMDWIIRSEKFLAVRTAAAIRSKKIFIRLNCWGYPFEKKIVICSNGCCFPFTKLISRSIVHWHLMGFRFSNGWDCLLRRNFVQPPEWLRSFKTNIQPFRFKRPRLSILKEKLYLKSRFKKSILWTDVITAHVMPCYDCLPVLFCYKLLVSIFKFCQVLKAELKKCVIKIAAIDLRKGSKNTSFIKTSRFPAFYLLSCS